jgi:hypothetical protein
MMDMARVVRGGRRTPPGGAALRPLAVTAVMRLSCSAAAKCGGAFGLSARRARDHRNAGTLRWVYLPEWLVEEIERGKRVIYLGNGEWQPLEDRPSH